MRVRKVLWTALLAVCMCFGAAALTACEHEHTEVVDASVEATCTQSGLTEGKHCSVCGEVLVKQEVIPAKGHTYSTAWTSDETYHWHEATCEHKDEVSGEAEHVFVDSVCSVCGYKETASEGLEFTLNADGNSYTVSGIGTCTDTKVVIPSEYNGKPVIWIGYKAFYNCSSLTSIVIPDGVTRIGNYAFEDCSSLTSIVIPDSVTSIWDGVFRDCSALTSIVIPDGVTGIGDYAFYNCSSLTSIVIPDGVTWIGNYAFSGCSSLTSIVIPDGVKSIEDDAFSGCSSLTSIVIPDGVKSIGSSAFSGCSALTSVVIPDSVTSIRSNAFSGCSALTSIVIPDGVTSIGNYAFRGCSSLESIIVAEGNTKYHSSGNCLIKTATKILVAGCKNSVIPTDGSVTSIGEEAFSGCSSLTSIVIPDSVTSIGDSAFSGCSSLESIIVAEGNKKYHSNGNCLIETATKILVAGCKNSVIPTDGSVTRIGNYAFENCNSLTSIVIPDGVTSIDGSAFSGCSALTSIVIPDSVTRIGDWTFYGCSSLTSVTIGNRVTSIDGSAFYNCSALESIIVAEGNKKYHSNGNCVIETATKILVAGCKNSVIPTDGSVTSIGNYAFLGCSSLTSIVIPDSVTSIGSSAFAYCSSLTSIVIPDSVTWIGMLAFNYCSKLTSIVIPDSVTSIGEQAFGFCSALEEIIFNGTMAQWKAIKKGRNWNYQTGNYTIYCTDGTISK